MAINTEGNIFEQEPDNTLRDRLVSEEQNIQAQSPATAPAPATTVRRPSATATAPLFTKQERIGYTLIPLASALLQGKRSGGGSLLNDTLGSLGQGLMGTADMALRIKQLEGKKRETGGGVKNVKLQPTAGQVEIQGQVYTPDMGREFTLDEATILMYPPDTFMDTTAQKNLKIDFEKSGIAYYMSKEQAKKAFPPAQFGNDYLKFVADESKGQKVGDLILGPNKRYSLINIGYQGDKPVRVNIVPSTTAAPKFSKDEDQLAYKTEAQAKKYLAALGVTPSMPNYDRLIRIMTTDPDGKKIVEGSDLIDTPVVRGDKYININLRYQDANLAGATTSEGGEPIYIQDYNAFMKKNYLPFIDKNNDRKTLIDEMDLFRKQLLNGELDTGFFAGILDTKFGRAARGLGLLTDTEMAQQTNIQNLRSFLGRVAGVFRAPGSGSTSDREFAAFQGAIANIENTPEANYLNMYLVSKRFEQQEKIINIQKEMLRKGKSQTEIDERLNKEVFSKPIAERIPDELIGNPEGIRQWYNSLKDGTVIFNEDSQGNPYLVGKEGRSIPVIHVKGFRKKKEQ